MSKLAVNRRNLFAYSVMAFPLAFAGIPLYLHAPDFYSTTLGLSLTTIGSILLFLRIIDAIQDPLIGYFSDKYNHRMKEIFITGIILLSVGFYTVFNPLEDLILSFALGIFLATTGFSIISINLNSLGGIWSNDYNKKTTISASRESLGVIGLILAVILPSVLSEKFGTKTGFNHYSVALLSLLVICGFLFIKFWLAHSTRKSKYIENSLNLNDVKNSIRKNKDFFLVYFLSVFASSIPAILIIFFVRDKLQMEGSLAIFLASYFISGALSMPFWNKLSKSINKIVTWKFSMILAVISFLWAYYLNDGDFYPFLAICIFSGFAFGAELALPPAILADYIEEESVATQYSILTFLMKMSLAVSAGLIFPILEMEGYKPGIVSNGDILSFYYALIPCILKLMAVIALIFLLKNKGVNDEKDSNNNDGAVYVSN